MDKIETVVQRIKEGETHLFEIIIETYQKPLFHYCYHMLGNVQDAEDAVQETLLKAFQKIGHYERSNSFSAWLYKIAHNHCLNVLRRKKLLSFIPLSNDSEKPWHYYVSNAMNSALDIPEPEYNVVNALKHLSPTEKSLLLLRIIDERSFEEVGKILNLKPANARKKYERMRRKLMKLLIQEKQGGHAYEGHSNVCIKKNI